jgi:hypothetical protein
VDKAKGNILPRALRIPGAIFGYGYEKPITRLGIHNALDKTGIDHRYVSIRQISHLVLFKGGIA